MKAHSSRASSAGHRRPLSGNPGKSRIMGNASSSESSAALKRELEEAMASIDRKKTENKALREDLLKVSDAKERLTLQLRMSHLCAYDYRATRK